MCGRNRSDSIVNIVLVAAAAVVAGTPSESRSDRQQINSGRTLSPRQGTECGFQSEACTCEEK